MIKKIIAFLLIFNMLPLSVSAEFQYSEELGKVCENLLNDVKEPSVSSNSGEWAVIALSRAGYAVPDDYFEKYSKKAADFIESKSTRKYTDYARVHLALLSIGKNPTGAEEYLKDFNSFKRQGVTACAYALIAINGDGMYEEYLEYILNSQHTDGGWGLGSTSDADVTAIVLQALSRYRDENINKAIEKGINYLNSVEVEFSETASQAVIAMCDLGIDPYVWAEKLMKFYKDGYFSHTLGSEKNQMSTEQGALALVALSSFEKNETLFPVLDTLFPVLDKEEKAINMLKSYESEIVIKSVLKTFYIISR